MTEVIDRYPHGPGAAADAEPDWWRRVCQRLGWPQGDWLAWLARRGCLDVSVSGRAVRLRFTDPRVGGGDREVLLEQLHARRRFRRACREVLGHVPGLEVS